MFAIFAKITPKPHFFEDAKKAILDIIPDTRAEKGCSVFNLHVHRDNDGQNSLCLYEIFVNEDAYNFHHSQDYTKKVFELYKDWLAEPVEINRMELVKWASFSLKKLIFRKSLSGLLQYFNRCFLMRRITRIHLKMRSCFVKRLSLFHQFL